MIKRTLTIMLGFVVLFAIAITAYPKLESKPKISKKNSSSLVAKTTSKAKASSEEKDGGYTTVSFGLNASFDKPEGFTLEAVK